MHLLPTLGAFYIGLILVDRLSRGDNQLSNAPNQTSSFRLAPTLFYISLLGSTMYEPPKNYFFAEAKKVGMIGSRMNTAA